MKTKEKILSLFLILILIESAIAAINYPITFQEKNTEIVIGDEAARSDYQSALKLADDFSHTIVTTQETIRSALIEEVVLGKAITLSGQFDQEINSFDLKDLQDTQINFQGRNYRIRDLLILGQSGNNIKVATSLTSDQKYESSPVIEADKGSIKYYTILQSIDLKKVTQKDPLEINFLGKTLKITKVESDSRFTAQVGTNYFLQLGESVTVENKKVTLKNIDANGVILIDVNGEVKTVPKDGIRIINELQVENSETFYTREPQDRSAQIAVGKSVLNTYNDGDPFIGEDKNKPRWIWNIKNLQSVKSSDPTIQKEGEGIILGIKNDFIMNNVNNKPLKTNECINLPDDYVSICFEDLIGKDYKTYTLSIDDKADFSNVLGDSHSKSRAIKLSTQVQEGILVKASSLSIKEISKNPKIKELWLYATDNTKLGVLYKDPSDNKIKLAGYLSENENVDIAEVNFGRTRGGNINIQANFNPNNELKIFVKPTAKNIENDDLEISFALDDFRITNLGTSNVAENSELKWNNQAIGLRSKDSLTNYGIIIRNPSSEGSNNKVRLELPNGQLKARINIKGPEKVEATTAEKIFLKSSKIETSNNYQGIAENIIFIGGPCANPKVPEFFDRTCSTWELKEGWALIKTKEVGDKKILLIAGTTAEDTVKAVDFLINKKEDLSNEELVIKL